MSTSEEYIKNRLDEQQDWYSKKATQNKTRYHASQIIIIAAGALIPIINIIDVATPEIRFASSILGGIILATTGIVQLFKSQENWILYRSTAEVLKKEKELFLNSVGDYSNIGDENKHKLLVERVESVISSENTKFFVTHSEKKQ